MLLYRAHVDVATVEHAGWELDGESEGEEVLEACGRLCKPPYAVQNVYILFFCSSYVYLRRRRVKIHTTQLSETWVFRPKYRVAPPLTRSRSQHVAEALSRLSLD